MEIKIFAASDRNNYGDLLFPLVLKKYIEINSLKCNFINYGMIRSDLSFFGALPTRSLDDLKNDLAYLESAKIIIAGGEVLGGNWMNILRFVSPVWNKLNKSKVIKRIIGRSFVLEKYFYIKKKGSYPFILDHPFYKKFEIFYNSVGAQSVKKLLNSGLEYPLYFQNIKLLSVRDNKSLENFQSHNIDVSLVPDSALIMSDLFSSELETLVSDKVNKMITQDYAFVQLGNNKGPNDLNKFKDDLEAFSARSNLTILLCPIGLAMDHDDNLILSELAGLSVNFTSHYPKNIFEIMKLIQYSKIYIGTSLHGVVTAQSFNVPFVAFTEKIKKLEYYVRTWFDSPEDILVDFSDFNKVNERFANFNVSKEKSKLRIQKQMIYDNLSEIFNEK